jgi:glycosyltransferase involved in cell wall biosynthesis
VSDPQGETQAPSTRRICTRRATVENASAISTIIPACNEHTKLQKKAVSSVLRQTTACHDLIVVNDGSIPPITDVNNLADPRVRIIRRENNRGAAAARNLGISAACSSVLAFRESQEVWYPSEFDKQLTFLNGGILYNLTDVDLPDRTKFRALGLVPQALQHVSLSSSETGARL